MHSLMLLALACSGSPENNDTGTAAVDLRRSFPAPPEGGLQFVTPVYTIPAHTEEQRCYFGSFEGETVGVNAQWTFQSQNGHHVVFTATGADPDLYPDGTWIDCTETDELNMADLDPVIIGGEVGNPTNNWEGSLALPESMAARLKGGTRFIIQSHYVNTTADPILVQDAVNFSITPEAEVETWAAPFVFMLIDHPIPAGQTHEETFDCAWEQDANLLFLAGHMHEYGTNFWTDLTTSAGTERIYELETWDPEFRDQPQYLSYDIGEFQVTEGDVFTTHCAWANTTEHTLDFPEEMCVTFGMAYPSKVPLYCDGGDR